MPIRGSRRKNSGVISWHQIYLILLLKNNQVNPSCLFTNWQRLSLISGWRGIGAFFPVLDLNKYRVFSHVFLNNSPPQEAHG